MGGGIRRFAARSRKKARKTLMRQPCASRWWLGLRFSFCVSGMAGRRGCVKSARVAPGRQVCHDHVVPFTDYVSGFVPPVDLSVLFDA
ncbi:MAG TPA: hypothetical protein VGF17_18395, partial [Phytomonospora sp.]